MASEMAIEVLYLHNLPENMGFMPAADTPVYEDKTACIEWGTMSSEDEGGPSISTFASTSRTKLFRTARCI